MLDYQNTAADLLGGVASAYALRFMGQAGMAMYRQFEADRDRGDFSILPELHSTLSALKVRLLLMCELGNGAQKRFRHERLACLGSLLVVPFVPPCQGQTSHSVFSPGFGLCGQQPDRSKTLCLECTVSSTLVVGLKCNSRTT